MIEMPGALSDIRVLDLSRLLPGPYCSMLLGDLGADVIKVEDPSGGDYLRWMPPVDDDGTSALFAPLNRNKRSIILDLKEAAGQEAFLRLVESADVVIESFRPGVIDRLGIGWELVHARNSRTILCSISGYGQDGPYRERAGHDLNYLALSGVLGMTGTRDGQLAIPGVQIGDLGGGALGATVAILAALHAREQTGAGQHCDVSMVDGLVSWLSLHLGLYFADQRSPGPAQQLLSGRYPCYSVYACADGHLSVAALEPKFWERLIGILALPHLSDAAFADGDAGDRVIAELAALFMTDTRDGWMRRFGESDVCVEPVLSLAEVVGHPQVAGRGMIVAPGVGGPRPQPGPPIRLSGTPLRTMRPAPGYGEHTEEVLREAGYSGEELEQMLHSAAPTRQP